MKYAIVALTLLTFVAGAGAQHSDAELQFIALRDAYLAKHKPLFLKATAAKWETLRYSNDEATARQQEAEKTLLQLVQDRRQFARLKALKEGGEVRDPVLRREMDVLYGRFLPAQVDPKLNARIIDLETEMSQLVNTHMSRVGNRELTTTKLRELLAETKDPAEAEAAWRGYMALGKKTAPRLRELVSLRNKIARELGYADFYHMKMALEETDVDELLKVFDELDDLTREPYAQVKAEIDAQRAAHFGIEVSELRPWHYADVFFQKTPPEQEIDFDALYAGADLEAIVRKYYANLGLSVDDVLAKSDLYDRPGKNPHGYCMNMNREGDMRVILNLKPTVHWANTALHELGHCVNDIYIRKDVPWVLKGPPHALTTEGVAMMFGAMSKHEEFLTKLVGVDPAEAKRVSAAARESLRRERLIFARWTQVMVRFEHAMYGNPDQDLGKLWWELTQRYQMIDPPGTTDRPDHAVKFHILTAPAYYHSYMLGEMFASQVRHAVAQNVLGLSDPNTTCFYDHPEIGAYLREKVFGPGDLYTWSEYVRRATGEPLTAKYLAADLKK